MIFIWSLLNIIISLLKFKVILNFLGLLCNYFLIMLWLITLTNQFIRSSHPMGEKRMRAYKVGVRK